MRKTGKKKTVRRAVAMVLLCALITGIFAVSPSTLVRAEAKTSTKVVVLDPGHGGAENGAVYYGMKEKDLNLKIAKYCKAELEKYAGVKVLMTRTTDRRLNADNLTQDLYARCLVAKNNNADIFVCLHNNAYGEGESTATHGARVYHQNNSFYRSVGRESKKLAKKIVKKVAACGLKNGGARTKYSSDKSRRDQNGKKGDCYWVLYFNKKFKIPAVIVEHAFMSNAGDAAKLKKEAFLKKLGQADAAAIADYLGLKKKPVTNKWVKKSGLYYYYRNGKMVTGWTTINGKKYYFSPKDGHMYSGTHTINGRKYTFSKGGVLKK